MGCTSRGSATAPAARSGDPPAPISPRGLRRGPHSNSTAASRPHSSGTATERQRQPARQHTTATSRTCRGTVAPPPSLPLAFRPPIPRPEPLYPPPMSVSSLHSDESKMDMDGHITFAPHATAGQAQLASGSHDELHAQRRTNGMHAHTQHDDSGRPGHEQHGQFKNTHSHAREFECRERIKRACSRSPLSLSRSALFCLRVRSYRLASVQMLPRSGLEWIRGDTRLVRSVDRDCCRSRGSSREAERCVPHASRSLRTRN